MDSKVMELDTPKQEMTIPRSLEKNIISDQKES